MSLTKPQIHKILKDLTAPGEAENLIDANALKNIQLFDKEVIIDVIISNPSLQAKKRMQMEITNAIHKQTNPNIAVTVHVSSKTPDKEASAQQIKGKKINGISNIIAVASGKGGVGKSTIAANLAVSLSKMGFRTGLLDADIYGPSVPTMFDVEGQRPLAVKVDNASKMKPIDNYGVQLLSIGFFTEANQAVIWRGPMASKALNQMIFDASWGNLDFLIIDLPPGTGDIHLSILQALPITGAVIVSTPQHVALADVRRGVAMFRQESIQVPVLGLIENMAYFTPKELPENKYYIFGKDGVKHLSKELGVPFLGEVPIEQSIREAADTGRPAALQKDTATQQAFEQLTRSIVAQTVKRNKDLPPSEAIKITNMAGCAAIKK